MSLDPKTEKLLRTVLRIAVFKFWLTVGAAVLTGVAKELEKKKDKNTLKDAHFNLEQQLNSLLTPSQRQAMKLRKEAKEKGTSND